MLLRSSLALVLAGAGTAQAAPPPVEKNSAIVVQGTRDRDRQIRDFVKDLTPAPIRGQLARFELPVCPVVLGIADAQAKVIEDACGLWPRRSASTWRNPAAW